MGTFSDLVANAWLDAVCNATSYSEAGVYVQLHTGDPGSAGTSNVATNSTRQSASFAAAASRAITTDAVVEWTSVSTTETYSLDLALGRLDHGELSRARRPLVHGSRHRRGYVPHPDRRLDVSIT